MFPTSQRNHTAAQGYETDHSRSIYDRRKISYDILAMKREPVLPESRNDGFFTARREQRAITQYSSSKGGGDPRVTELGQSRVGKSSTPKGSNGIYE